MASSETIFAGIWGWGSSRAMCIEDSECIACKKFNQIGILVYFLLLIGVTDNFILDYYLV